MAKKFNITQTGAGIRKNEFVPPIPGFQTKPRVIIQSAVRSALQKFFISTDVEAFDKEVGYSKKLNTKVFSNIEFEGGSYVDEDGATIDFNGLKIDLVIIEVNNTKNIIKTSLQGRSGTVKEYISDGDFDIKIQGALFGDGATAYPESDVQALIGLCKAPQALTINSDFLKLFGITSIVIDTYTMPQEEGVRNVQRFTLTCSSDKELILLKNA